MRVPVQGHASGCGVRTHLPAFGYPGLEVDDLLRAASDVWITCDEFAAACAAMAFHMLTGLTAPLIALPGPGTDLAWPGLAMAAREGIELEVQGVSMQLPRAPLMVTPGSEDPVTLVRFRDLPRLHAVPADVDIVTQSSSIPGAALFGARWLGHVGFLPDPDVLAEVRVRGAVDLDAQPVCLVEPASPPHEATPLLDAAVRRLDQCLPPASPIVPDAGGAHAAVSQIVARRGLRPVVQTTQLTTMGWSLGAAVGVHAARPDVPLGVVVGDGSLLMRLGDLAVLARYRIPAVVLVVVNGVLGQGREQWGPGDRHRIARLPAVDWASACRALGVAVRDDLASAVAAADAGPQVVLLEVTEQ